VIKLKLRKKDKVMVIAGKDKGKTGEVLKIYPDKLRILVGKINIVTKHEKPRQNQPGGLQKMEAAIAYSNVMLVCPKCDKPTKTTRKANEGSARSGRVCRTCNEALD